MRNIGELVEMVEASEKVNEAFDGLITRIGEVFRRASLYRTTSEFDRMAFFGLTGEIELCITHSGSDRRVIDLCKEALSYAGLSTNECRIDSDGNLSRRQVYFVKNAKGLIKIGSAMNVTARIKQLETGASEPLVLIAQMDGSTSTETSLHRRFVVYRVHGEWFSPGASLMEYIQDLTS